MSVIKYTAVALTLACCDIAVGQVSQQATDQTRRAERVEERRDQISDNRDARQDNRDARQAERAADGRDLGSRIGNALDNNQSSNMDQFIATCLLLGNQEEVELAQLAADRAENENVKQFAQMLVADHQKAIQKLQQHAKQGISLDGAATITAAGAAPSAQPSNNQIASNDLPTAREVTANRVDIDRDPMAGGALEQVMKMNQQAAQECLSMTKSMMQEKQGAEFDKAFAGSQIGAHVGMLAKLKAAEQHASPELASMIKQSQQSVQSHLEHAKQLCEELESMQASNR
jgi:predicted outer membrane protein